MYTKNPKIVEKKTDNGMLIFNADTGHMVELNVTASLMWEKSEDKFDGAQLKKIIEENCTSVGDDVEKDLSEFIEKALENKMVEKDGEN